MVLRKDKIIKILLCYFIMEKRFKFYAFKLAGVIILVFLAQVLISGFTEFFIESGILFSNLEVFHSDFSAR